MSATTPVLVPVATDRMDRLECNRKNTKQCNLGGNQAFIQIIGHDHVLLLMIILSKDITWSLIRLESAAVAGAAVATIADQLWRLLIGSDWRCASIVFHTSGTLKIVPMNSMARAHFRAYQ